MGKFDIFGDGDDDLIFGSEPTPEELEKIENEGITLANNEELKKVAEDVKNEIGSNIDNSGKTWCESAAGLDGFGSSSYSKLNNADELGNTASPYRLTQEK